MDFLKLVSELKTLEIKETRFDSAHYFEISLRVENLERTNQILTKQFGPEVKDPPQDILEKLELEGGLRSDQTLYLAESNQKNYCAMIWPWADKSAFTLRVSLLH